ncbi:MAG: peptidylprolyl isomerase [bacterium]
MMIMKFNKMIRNKVVWWIIAGVVIVTFVGFFTPNGGCDKGRPVGKAGTLDGVPVTDSELRQARLNTYMGLCLSVGKIITITPRLDRELREMSWKRVAALRAAQEMGITSSPEEVLAMLKRDPQFQEDGTFSKQRYQYFCQSVLGSLNVSMPQFEHQLTENIILQKLHGIASSAVWVSATELNRMAARYADSFRIDYISLDTNSIPPESVTVSESDLQSYYTRNTNAFMVPPKVAVRYIDIPVADYMTKAVEKVDTNSIEEYYASHNDEFSTTDTNGVKSVTPFETVSAVISNRLIHAAAIQLARDAANDLSDSLVPDLKGNSLSFDAMAAKAKLSVHKTDLFDRESELPGIDAGMAFKAAAFRVRPANDERFSDAIAGSNHIYLLTLATNTEAYIPAFDAVRSQVKPLAVSKAILEALDQKAKALHLFFQTGLNNKKSFISLAKEMTLNVHTTAVFSAYSAPDNLSSPEILSDITARNAGELSDVLPGADGLIIAYVVERTPASPDELSSVQNQVMTSTIRRRTRLLFGEWQKSLIAGGKKKDLQTVESSNEKNPVGDDALDY